MGSDDWSVLGIGPTDDPKVLRKAYSRKLREHPPERDPEGFMRLRAAYERLLAAWEGEGSSVDAFPSGKSAREPEHGRPVWIPPTSASGDEPCRTNWSPHPFHGRLEVEHWMEDHWSLFLGLWSQPGSWSRLDLWEMWLDEIRRRGPEARQILEDRLIGYFGGFFQRTPYEEVMMPAIREIARSWDWEGRRKELYGRYDRRLMYGLIRVARGNWRSRGVPLGGNLEGPGEDSGASPEKSRWGPWLLGATIAGWLCYFLYEIFS